MNMNDKIEFVDGPKKGKAIRAHLAAPHLEGDNWPGRYDLVTVMAFNRESREYRTRQEYRYDANFSRSAEVTA